MRRHRIAVASNLRSKIGEMGFFLGQILEASRIIERKHAAQNYPINTELDRLNYFFSSFHDTPLRLLLRATKMTTATPLFPA